jgi:hypothetical protein
MARGYSDSLAGECYCMGKYSIVMEVSRVGTILWNCPVQDVAW